MAGPAALQRLLAWLSPASPVGAAAWLQGPETAVADGRAAYAADIAQMRHETIGTRVFRS